MLTAVDEKAFQQFTHMIPNIFLKRCPKTKPQ